MENSHFKISPPPPFPSINRILKSLERKTPRQIRDEIIAPPSLLVLQAKPGGTAGALHAERVSKAAGQPTCFLTSGSASPDSDLGSNRSPLSSSRSVRKCIPLTTLSDLMYVASVFPSVNDAVSSPLFVAVVVEGADGGGGGGGGGGDDEEDDVQISNVMSLGRQGSWSGRTWK